MGIVSLGWLQSDGLHNALPLFRYRIRSFAPSLAISSLVVTLFWQRCRCFLWQ